MKINDYVRTDKGEIGKVSSVTKEDIGFGDIEFCNTEPYVYGTIIKSSPYIIDLIEVGDYVNGEKVGTTIDTKELAIRNTSLIYDKPYNLIKDIDIKSIVTKQQFSQMEYRINE